MITGLLFTLTQGRAATEGHTFPNKAARSEAKSKQTKGPARAADTVVKLARVSGLALALVGLMLMGVGGVEWSFDPASGLNIQTALISFTLPAGVFS